MTFFSRITGRGEQSTPLIDQAEEAKYQLEFFIQNAKNLENTKNFSEAVEAYKQALGIAHHYQEDKESFLYLRIASCYLNLQNFDEAKKFILCVVDKNKKQPSLYQDDTLEFNKIYNAILQAEFSEKFIQIQSMPLENAEQVNQAKSTATKLTQDLADKANEAGSNFIFDRENEALKKNIEQYNTQLDEQLSTLARAESDALQRLNNEDLIKENLKTKQDLIAQAIDGFVDTKNIELPSNIKNCFMQSFGEGFDNKPLDWSNEENQKILLNMLADILQKSCKISFGCCITPKIKLIKTPEEIKANLNTRLVEMLPVKHSGVNLIYQYNHNRVAATVSANDGSKNTKRKQVSWA